MKKGMLRTSFWLAVGSSFLSTAGLAGAVSFPECITNSQDANTIIQSAPCGIYGIVSSRQENAAGDLLDVTVKYMVHMPVGAPKAVVMLFAGGVGNTSIEGNEPGGAVTNAGNNFLVRSAQLFAEDGYLVVTIDRPSTGAAINPAYDQYRVSPSHAHDIVAVLSDANSLLADLSYPYDTALLDLFLAGTSRGSISVVAQSNLGIGSMLSSPVTSPNQAGTTLWVGADSNHPRLVPGFVAVPSHVLSHAQDGCPVTPPANSEQLRIDFHAAGVDSFFNSVDGGFELEGEDPCQARTFHGFLGIERTAAQKITNRMDYFLKKKGKENPENVKPIAGNGNAATTMNSSVDINLASLSSDANGDTLTYSLPHAMSSRDGSLSINGSMVTYSPPGGRDNITDGFVYQVSDGNGGVSNGLISVLVGVN